MFVIKIKHDTINFNYFFTVKHKKNTMNLKNTLFFSLLTLASIHAVEIHTVENDSDNEVSEETWNRLKEHLERINAIVEEK